MTRTFDGRVCCPNCKTWHTAETALERWIRNSEELDSRLKGIVRFDCDILFHRYMIHTDKRGSRDLQCVMFIEAKTHGAELSIAQRDTLSMFSQVLRNRKRNVHADKKGRHATGTTAPATCWSQFLSRNVRLWMFGGHILTMSGDSPTDSVWMRWDSSEIDVATLVRILRFELDPDNITKEIDWRRRYSSFDQRQQQRWLDAVIKAN
jgi:hypothetical protein